MNFDLLVERIKSKPDLNFGTIFSQSIQLFKKVWVQGFVILWLTFLTILPFYIILYIPMIALGITDPESMIDKQLPPMVAVSMGIIGSNFYDRY